MKVLIHTDGGAVGNPGPAAIGIVIKLPNELLTRDYSKYIGEATNNFAEYQAMIFALKKVKQLIGGKNCRKAEIMLYSDSQLIVSQLNGKYKIKEKTLFPLFIDIWNLKQDFKKVEFIYIPREENKEADKLVKQQIKNK